MARYAALLRGINVGGKKRLPMADLKAAAQGLGWQQVETYIASGNLVFSADEGSHAQDLEQALRQIGLSVPVVVLRADHFATCLASNPYPQADGKTVHGFVHDGAVTIDWALYDNLRKGDEELVQADGVLWLSTPQGFGRSDLAAKFDRVVKGAAITGRNLNTWRKLAEMLDSHPA